MELEPLMTVSLYDMIENSVAAIRKTTPRKPSVGIILGTGMGEMADRIPERVAIPYDTIPDFPVSTVESHKGNLVFGKLGGKDVVMMQGRFHRYEGYSLQQVTYPVRVMKALGISTIIVMNATGSVNPHIPKGSLVLLTDHINLMGDNPLIGPNDERLGPRFPDMSEPYDRKLLALAEEVALANKIRVHRGVCVAVTGPNLETAAEYRMFQRIGVDVVSMSTIPEVIVAKHAGLRVVGISTVTDECYPDALKEAKLEEIIAVANELAPARETLVTEIVAKL